MSNGTKRGRSCPECGGTPVPVVYGLPGPELFRAADRGEVRLGGCIVPRGPRCRTCGSDLSTDVDSYRHGRGALDGYPDVVLLRMSLNGDREALAELMRRRAERGPVGPKASGEARS